MTADARMTRLARASSSPREARTSAVITTLVATMAAAMKSASTGGRCQRSATPPAITNDSATPQTATATAVLPVRSKSDVLTSRPMPKSRNMTPSSERALRKIVGPNPAEHVRADEQARDDLAHDAGLADALEQFAHQSRGGEDGEDGQRYFGRIGQARGHRPSSSAPAGYCGISW